MTDDPKLPTEEELSAAASTLGKKGGAAVLKKRGKEHFQRMGQISGSQRDREELRKMGNKGGNETYRRYGKEHYKRLSLKGRRARDAKRVSYEAWAKQRESKADSGATDS